MGWHNLKKHFSIGHIVTVTPQGICIGSPYVRAIMVISAEGVITKPYDGSLSSNEDLARYQREIAADPVLVKRLIETPDTFAASLPVFTYDGATIIETRCEALGWPNVTHDGELMHVNTHSPNRETVIRWAKENAAAGVKMDSDLIAKKEKELADLRVDHVASQRVLASLDAQFPDVVVSRG